MALNPLMDVLIRDRKSREGHGKTESEVGVMYLQGKERQGDADSHQNVERCLAKLLLQKFQKETPC